MADNVVITAGTGTTVGADEVTDGTLGTVKIQYVKIMDATLDGTNKLVVTASGAVKSDGSAVTQPVSAASLPLPTGAATLAKQPALGTAGSAATDVITIQGIASMTAVKVDNSAVTQPISAASLPLPTGAATAALQPTAAAQGSTTSGQTGHLMQGAVTTAVPSYTTAQTSPLSLATNGALRVDIGGTSANATAIKVDGSAAIALNSGANGATVQRVTVATDDTMMTSIRSPGLSASVSVTRTADTNVYAAGDVLGAATGSTAALDFNLAAVSGSKILITSVAFERDTTALISGETSYTLHLYNVTPPSALGDNAAFDLPSGDRASYLGNISLGTPVDLGSTLYVEINGINKQVLLAGTHIFAYLVTVGTYTPTSAAVHKVTLHAMQI